MNEVDKAMLELLYSSKQEISKCFDRIILLNMKAKYKAMVEEDEKSFRWKQYQRALIDLYNLMHSDKVHNVDKLIEKLGGKAYEEII